MTKEGKPLDLGESVALTVLIDNGNSIYYYEGKFENALKNDKIKATSLSGDNSLRNIIIEKQKRLDVNPKIKEGRRELMLLIKPGKEANYKTIIDVLDETTINMVEKYAVLNQSKAEMNWMKEKIEN